MRQLNKKEKWKTMKGKILEINIQERFSHHVEMEIYENVRLQTSSKCDVRKLLSIRCRDLPVICR